MPKKVKKEVITNTEECETCSLKSVELLNQLEEIKYELSMALKGCAIIEDINLIRFELGNIAAQARTTIESIQENIIS